MSEQDDAKVEETEVEEPDTEDTKSEEEDADPEGTEQLGDAGKKALDAMKARMRDERTKRREAEAKLAELAKQPPKPAKPESKPAEGDKPDGVDPEEIRRQVEAELTAKMAGEQARERVLDKIEVKAAKAFADPADAPLMLMREHKIDDFLDDDGKPDLEAIQDALKELLEKKPYLAAAQGGRRFQGSGDGGAKPPKPARPKSLDEAVKTRLSN